MIKIDNLLEGMSKIGASDLHLKVGSPPVMRVTGRMRPVEHAVLTEEDTKTLTDQLVPERLREEFETRGAADFSYMLAKTGRFRVAVFHQRGLISATFRRVSLDVPRFAELCLPPVVETVIDVPRGLILITGVTGSGKSSTLAAIIQHFNSTRRAHIVTMEDPIEFLFTDDHCLINQLEVGIDCVSFADTMHRVLRFDPDVIMIGEMRDRETIETALQAVDTGHLVLSTLHTSDAKQTVNRILNFFPQDEEKLILEQLSLNLRAIVSQRLMARCDVKGMIPACEILINTPIVTKLIVEGRIDDLQTVLRKRESGMQSFDIAMAELARDGKVSPDEALKFCTDEPSFRRLLRGESADGDRGGLLGSGGGRDV